MAALSNDPPFLPADAPALRVLYVARMRRTESPCKQCGKPARSWVGVDDDGTVVRPLCDEHTRLAIEHYLVGHKLTRAAR